MAVEPVEIGRSARVNVIEELARLGYRPPSLDFSLRIETFAATLALWGSKLNLTSVPDDPREIAFHIIDSLAPMILAQAAEGETSIAKVALAGAFELGTRVLDLGSGAGFPALILAAAYAGDASPHFTLLEARRKRASFLSVAAAEMGLTNVRVDSSRTDSMALEPVFDLVTARAFAEPAIVYRTAAAALKSGGRAILYASPAQRPVIEQAGGPDFEPPTFFHYELPRGETRVAHLLAVSKRR
jgi:16S rRNA (guanine527-N7)-methyltransferase